MIVFALDRTPKRKERNMEMETGGTFETFAGVPEYQMVNQFIADSWFSSMGVRINRFLDVASGVGTTAMAVLNALPRSAPRPEVVCLDESDRALHSTRVNLLKILPEDLLSLIHGKIQDGKGLSLLFGKPFDLATWGNGIHYLSPDDQHSALQRIHKGLRPGGFLGISTTFHKEAVLEETRSFYRDHILGAVRILRSSGIKRDKDVHPPEAASYRSASYYRELLVSAGFRVVEEESFSVLTTLDFWRAISDYDQYAVGALHGYPLEAAREALVQAVEPAFVKHAEVREDGQSGIPRVWFSVLASRRD